MVEKSQILSYKFDIKAFPPKLYSKAIYIVHKLKEKGHVAFFVGGVIRDVLMGRQPTEIDITTSAPPEVIKETFDKVYLVGVKFGVCVVNIDGFNFEVSTFRKDSTYKDGRHPESIAFSNPKEDAERRDFTINALFWEPIDSKLYDYVGGLGDIHNAVIRAVGDPYKRFEEDRLRILRCARFLSELEFYIEEETFEAMSDVSEPLKGLSMERIRDEIEKIILSAKPSLAFRLLDELNILKDILPEISSMKGIAQPKEFHPEGDVWNHTMLALDVAAKAIRERDNVLMWAVLLHDIAKPSAITFPEDDEDRIRFHGHDTEGEKLTREILLRFKLPNKVIEAVSYIVRNHMRIGQAQKMRKGRLKLLMAEETFENELWLNFVDSHASHRDLSTWEFLSKEYEKFKEERSLPQAIVNGELLIKMGYKPSPIFSKIIKESYEAQLDGSFSNVTGAKKFIKNLKPTSED